MSGRAADPGAESTTVTGLCVCWQTTRRLWAGPQPPSGRTANASSFTQRNPTTKLAAEPPPAHPTGHRYLSDPLARQAYNFIFPNISLTAHRVVTRRRQAGGLTGASAG